jgi:hypothetical protein
LPRQAWFGRRKEQKPFRTTVPGFTADTPDFPFSRSALNGIVLHPRILRAAAQLLKVENEDVRFYGDVVLGKYGVSPPDGDQDLHLDFGNNTLLVPPSSAPETVNVILNYSEDAIETDGATRFVAEHGLCALAPQPGEAPAQASPFYDSSEALYERERAVRYTAGTCLLYRLDFLHRGSPVLPGKVRWTHHTNYKRADCEWCACLPACLPACLLHLGFPSSSWLAVVDLLCV